MIHTMKRFYERLREARKAAGYTSQEKFSEVIGMKRTQYLLYETGEKLPDPEITLPKIAEGLQIPYEEVMAWYRLDGSTPKEAIAILKELLGDNTYSEELHNELKKRDLA